MENEKTYTEAEMQELKKHYEEAITEYKKTIEISQQYIRNIEEINKILAQKNALNESAIEKQQNMIKHLTPRPTPISKTQQKTTTKCPLCCKENLVKSKRKNGENYYYCPQCSATYPEKNGEPDTTIEYCPECGEVLKHFFSNKTKSICFYCEKCRKYYNDENGKPTQQ